MRQKLFLFIIIFTLCSSHAYAQEHNPLRKLGRGVANVSLCWLELFIQPSNVAEEEGKLAAMYYGPIKGLLCSAGRALLGAYETATFLIPPYQPVVEPEFVIPEEVFSY